MAFQGQMGFQRGEGSGPTLENETHMERVGKPRVFGEENGLPIRRQNQVPCESSGAHTFQHHPFHRHPWSALLKRWSARASPRSDRAPARLLSDLDLQAELCEAAGLHDASVP